MVAANALLITSDRTVANELYKRLIKLGYIVTGVASTEEEAVQKMEAFKPDLILTDIHLENTKKGELQTGKLIRMTYDVPIIYIAESVGQATIRRARPTGPFGYVYRPFDDQQLLVTIETALTRYQLERKLKESRQWLNTTLTSIGDGVIATDEQGQVRFINPVATEYTGWQHINAIGQPLSEVFPFVDEDSREPINLLLMEDGPQSITNIGFKGILLPRYRKPTPIEASITSIKDEKGKIYGTVLVFRDVI